MKIYQQRFIEFLLRRKVLAFGKFKLNSGRISPYFFNTGLLNTGEDLSKLGSFYAEALVNSGISFNLLFGPAYKGIPITTSTAIALSHYYNLNLPYCFNRKEVKDHGEGGNIVGQSPNPKSHIMIIDDVITTGKAIRDSIKLIQSCQAKPAGIIVSLDRQEYGKSKLSAIQELECDYGCQIVSIIEIHHLIQYLKKTPGMGKHLKAITNYHEQYGSLL